MSEKRGLVRHIPNVITLINLACGSLAIYYVFETDWMMVCILIGIGGLADFLDGLIARWLGVSSTIGKELDSLADMISFGLVPGMVIFKLLIDESFDLFEAIPALLIPIGAGLRLAKFNTLDDTAGDFIGLSTPAMTAFVMGFLLWFSVFLDSLGSRTEKWLTLNELLILYGFCFLLPILMNSKIEMFSLKFKGLGWKENEIRWIFIGLFIILSILNPWISIFTTMFLYILVNTILHFYKKLA